MSDFEGYQSSILDRHMEEIFEKFKIDAYTVDLRQFV
jgi:glutaminase